MESSMLPGKSFSTGIIDIIRGLSIDHVQGNNPCGRIETSGSLYSPCKSAPALILERYNQTISAAYISSYIHSKVSHIFNYYLSIIRAGNIKNLTRVSGSVNRPATGSHIINTFKCISDNSITCFPFVIGITVTPAVNTQTVLASYAQAFCNAAGVRTKKQHCQVNNASNREKVRSDYIQSIFFTAKLSHLTHPESKFIFRI